MHFKHSSNKICSVLNYLSPYFKDSAQTRHHVQSKYGVCVILFMFGVFACVRVCVAEGQNEENHKYWSLIFLEGDDMIG